MHRHQGKVSALLVSRYKNISMADTAQIIFNTARGDGMPLALAELIVSQARHETANFTSNVFRNDNNAFGYKYVPGAKYQVSKGTPIGDWYYARYANVVDSTHELTAWIKRRQAEDIFPSDLRLIKTADQYAALLKQANYYQDSVSNYVQGLKRWFQSFADGGVYTLIGAAVLWLLYRYRKQLF